MILCDDEFGRVLLVYFGGLFGDAMHHSAARAARKRNMKARKLRVRAYRVDFHAAIAQIANVSSQAQVFRDVLREVAEPYSLHQP